jgi:predicted nucleic acid-binding protein
VTYLLDVNSLLALGVLHHEFHERVAAWVARLAKKGIPDLATCSITELGFVRVLSQAQQFRFSVVQARELLLQLKVAEAIHCTFIPDGLDVSCLPKRVRSPKQITDGHLVELAKANGAQLATLDEKVPGSFLIPSSR